MNSLWLRTIREDMKKSLILAKQFELIGKLADMSMPQLLNVLRILNKDYPQFPVLVHGDKLLYFFHASEKMKEEYLPWKLAAFAIVEAKDESLGFRQVSFSCKGHQDEMYWGVSAWEKMSILYFLEKEKVL